MNNDISHEFAFSTREDALKYPRGRGEDGRRAHGAQLANRGVFLLSFQVDVPGVLARLDDLGLGGSPRTMTAPRGDLAATVTDPDGVMVELLPARRAVLS